MLIVASTNGRVATAALPDECLSAFGLIAVNARGEHLAIGNQPGVTYVMADSMTEPVESERLLAP